GKVSGVGRMWGGVGARRLELLRGLVPNAKLIAVLVNPTNPAEDHLRGEQEVARSIGQHIFALGATTADEIERAYAAFIEQRSDALLVNADALFTAQRGSSSRSPPVIAFPRSTPGANSARPEA